MFLLLEQLINVILMQTFCMQSDLNIVPKNIYNWNNNNINIFLKQRYFFYVNIDGAFYFKTSLKYSCIIISKKSIIKAYKNLRINSKLMNLALSGFKQWFSTSVL